MEPWFKVEKETLAVVDPARASENWETLASALDSLCTARQSIAGAARKGKLVNVIDSMEDIDSLEKGGRYLVRPPLVARDASILDHTLKLKGISVVVLCREPITQLGKCPIVALGSGVTIRTQIEEPANPDKPSCRWFDLAVEALGACVVDRIDTEATPQRQLNYLLAHLSAIPMHVDSYRAAIALCDALASESV